MYYEYKIKILNLLLSNNNNYNLAIQLIQGFGITPVEFMVDIWNTFDREESFGIEHLWLYPYSDKFYSVSKYNNSFYSCYGTTKTIAVTWKSDVVYNDIIRVDNEEEGLERIMNFFINQLSY